MQSTRDFRDISAHCSKASPRRSMLARAIPYLIAAIVSFTLCGGVALADDDCTALLTHGLYDHLSTLSTDVQAATFQSNFCETYSKYESDTRSGNAAASYGLYNGSIALSSDQVKQLGSLLCTNAANNSSMQSALSSISSVIDGNAVNAFNSCVALNSQPDGIHVYPQTSLADPTTVSLSVRYIAAGNNNLATLQYVHFDEHAMTCTGDLLNKNTAISSSYRNVTCTRHLAAQPFEYNVGTTREAVYAAPTTITIATNAGAAFSETLAAVSAAPQAPPSASIPIGGIIVWYRFNSSDPIPDGYWICDGSTINDPNSRFNTHNAPSLVDKFVMGVTLPRVGEVGGSNVIPNDGGGSYSYSGTTSDAKGNGDGYAPAGGPGSNKDGNQVSGLGHTHGYSGNIAIAPHNHGGDKRPAYVGLVYLIRIR